MAFSWNQDGETRATVEVFEEAESGSAEVQPDEEYSDQGG
jgi:hypothetical protein